MSDQGVREIQLSGKQLVFLFMAAVVFTVVVFLLGVSVGRGVRDRTGGAPVMASAGGATKPADLPPPTKPAPGDLTYDKALQEPKAGEAPKPAADLPKVDSPEVARQKAIAAQIPPPPPPPPPPPAETKAAPPAGTPYWVQVGVFKDRSNADKLVRELKTQGFAAGLQTSGGSVRVRVGPYDDKAQADAAAKRLTRYKAMVTR
jgi:cell division protein FtsN